MTIPVLFLSLLLASSSCSFTASGLHIGLIVPGHAGHLLPTATLGKALKHRGHRITLISTPPGSKTAEQNGLEFMPIGVPEFHSGVLRVYLEKEGRLRGLSAFWHTIQLFKREEQIILRDLPDVIQTLRIDAVCVDQLLPAAMDVADVHGIPFGVLCNALPVHLDPDIPPFVTSWAPPNGDRWLRLRNRATNVIIATAAAPIYIALNRYRAKYGLTLHTGRRAQHVGKIQITQIPSFVDFPRSNLPNHFFYSRPWHQRNRDDDTTSFPWDRLDGRPIVYASLGSVQTGLTSMYLAICDACRDLDDIQLVLSLGRKGATLPPNRIPSNAVVVDYAPQLQILQSASVVLTHGGLNTALETLACGLPTVIVPLCNDQPGIASRMASLGVSQIVPPRRAISPEVLKIAILNALSDPSYQKAATRCQQMMLEQCPTLAQTAELIEIGLGRCTPLHNDDQEVKRILGLTPVANMTVSRSSSW